MDRFDDGNPKCITVMKANGLSGNAISILGSFNGIKALFKGLNESISAETPRSELEDTLEILRLCEDELAKIKTISGDIEQKIANILSQTNKL